MKLDRGTVRVVMETFPYQITFKQARKLILTTVQTGPSEVRLFPGRLKCYKLVSETHFLYVVCQGQSVVKARVLPRNQLTKLFIY